MILENRGRNENIKIICKENMLINKDSEIAFKFLKITNIMELCKEMKEDAAPDKWNCVISKLHVYCSMYHSINKINLKYRVRSNRRPKIHQSPTILLPSYSTSYFCLALRVLPFLFQVR